MSARGWIGVDLDGTLAHYDKWRGEQHVGDPVPRMKALVEQWLLEGIEVRIFTARVAEGEGRHKEDVATITTIIQDWCERHGLPRLPVTNIKDFGMLALYDDRAASVQKNTGIDLKHWSGHTP